MKIRTMQMDDYDDVYQLWMSCVGMGLNNLDDSREGIEKFLKRNPGTCFIAEVDAKIVGVIIIGHDGRRGYIYHTAVHPQYRKQGIARQLVNQGIEALGQRGINKVAWLFLTEIQQATRFGKSWDLKLAATWFTATSHWLTSSESIPESCLSMTDESGQDTSGNFIALAAFCFPKAAYFQVWEMALQHKHEHARHTASHNCGDLSVIFVPVQHGFLP